MKAKATNRRSRRAALALGLAVFTAAAGATALEQAREELRAAVAAHQRAQAAFQAARQQDTLPAAEMDDYRAFLARLEEGVLRHCREVLRLRAAAGDSGPEPGCSAHAGAPPPVLAYPDEQTEAERVRALDRQLGGSLSEFDELLLREMEEVAAARSGSPDGGGAGAEGGGAGASGAAGGQQAESGEGDTRTTAARPPAAGTGRDQDLEKPPQTTQKEGSEKDGGTPRTAVVKRDPVPGAADDDIVARQLREAAESETDPELRAKLWEEYRRYKGEQAQTQ